jgi:epoxide hydrolase-like predicted phosphatase
VIKAVLFDWGGVMSNGGRGTEISARLVRNLQITSEQADNLIHSIWHDYVRGLMNESEVWVRFEQAYGKPIPLEKRKVWNTWENTALIPEMGEFVRNLRRLGYRVGLVSNTIPNTSKEIRHHEGYGIFEFVVLSHEVGVAKPDQEIFELALEHLNGILPSEIVFVDDQERCLVPARGMGMKTVLAETVPQIIQDIQSLLTEAA